MTGLEKGMDLSAKSGEIKVSQRTQPEVCADIHEGFALVFCLQATIQPRLTDGNYRV